MMNAKEAKECPIIYDSAYRRPVISRVNLAINPRDKKSEGKILEGTQYLTERELYEISKSEDRFYVVLNPSNVLVRSKTSIKEIERPLKESALFKSVTAIKGTE